MSPEIRLCENRPHVNHVNNTHVLAVITHSRAHTLDDDSLTLETETVNTHSLVARAQPVMGLVYSGGARALK